MPFFGKGIEYKCWDIMIQLYKSLVGLHLMYCVLFWSYIHWKDVSKQEKMQKRITRMVPRLMSLSYRESLDRMGLLECRRLRILLRYTRS